MLKTRSQNVTSATWSPNGEALGTVDLTKDDNNPFGVNVFSPAVQKDVLPKDVYEKLQATLEHGEALDHLAGRRGRGGDEGVGARARGDALHPRLPAPHGPDSREA